jgi:V/A-type H+/Na+-transporting ATPase subunit B
MDFSSLYVKEGRAISSAKGALLVAESIPGIKFNEMVDVHLGNGEVKSGQAIDISEEAAIIEVFGGSAKWTSSEAG